ncbi:MAG: hypothetical protein ACJ8E3_05905 [Sphingomicrobium sp.]
MSNLSISRAWDEAKHVLAHDGKLITSVALALIVLPQTVSGVIAPPATLSGANPPSWMPFVAILVAILGITGQVAVARLALGPSTSVGESIQHGFRRVVPAFLALLVLFLALVVVLLPIMLAMAGPEGLKSVTTETPTPAAAGALLLVVFLCLLAAPRFQLVVPTAAAEEGGPIRLLQRSWRMTEGSYLKLLGFLALVLIAAVVVLFTGQIIVGLVAKAMFGTVHPYSLGALLAGLLTAMISAAFAAVSTVILARIYVQLAGRGGASVPSSGT